MAVRGSRSLGGGAAVVSVAAAVLSILALGLSAEAAKIPKGRYGDRPGQLRDSAFSSFGHHGKKCSNDPRMWPDKYKRSPEEISKLTYVFVAPGSREAMRLHDTDVSRKVTKAAKRARSLSTKGRSVSARARSASVAGRSTSRKASAPSDLALSNRDKVAKIFSGDKQAANKPVKFELLRLLRFSYMRKQDLPPAGLWTAKSRPSSLLRETQVEKKRLERKIRLAHAKRLKGPGDRSRSRSAKPRSASVRSASSKKSKKS